MDTLGTTSEVGYTSLLRDPIKVLGQKVSNSHTVGLLPHSITQIVNGEYLILNFGEQLLVVEGELRKLFGSRGTGPGGIHDTNRVGCRLRESYPALMIVWVGGSSGFPWRRATNRAVRIRVFWYMDFG